MRGTCSCEARDALRNLLLSALGWIVALDLAQGLRSHGNGAGLQDL
jgi:hypothetical protein